MAAFFKLYWILGQYGGSNTKREENSFSVAPHVNKMEGVTGKNWV